jgi:hypothetical protein
MPLGGCKSFLGGCAPPRTPQKIRAWNILQLNSALKYLQYFPFSKINNMEVYNGIEHSLITW